MDKNQISGILAIILGLIFIIFPVFSMEFIDILIGVSLIFAGIAAIVTGINFGGKVSWLHIILGILAILIAFSFFVYFDALAIIVSFQFYLIGFIFIFFGVSGLLSPVSKSMSILILLMGVIAVLLAVFSLANPLFIAIIVGISLIAQGVTLFIGEQ